MLKVNLQKRDYILFEYIAATANIFSNLWPILIIAALYYEFFISPNQNRQILMILMVMTSLYIFKYAIFIPMKGIKKYNISSEQKNQMRISIHSYGIEIKRGENRSIIYWNDFKDIWMRQGYLLLYISKENVIIIPKRAYAQNMQQIREIKKYRKFKNPYRLKGKSILKNILIIVLVLLSVFMFLFPFISK